MYNNDIEIVEAICAAKLQSGDVKPHPDLPDDDSALMYYAACLFSICSCRVISVEVLRAIVLPPWCTFMLSSGAY